jgi:hypothetical protein
MNVVTLVDFHDNLKDVDRKAGEEFVVTRERYEEINAVGAEKIGAPIVEEVVHTADAKGVQTPEKRAKRAASSRKAK